MEDALLPDTDKRISETHNMKPTNYKTPRQPLAEELEDNENVRNTTTKLYFSREVLDNNEIMKSHHSVDGPPLCTVCFYLDTDFATSMQMLLPENILNGGFIGAVEITTTMCELVESATSGCPSCMVLLAAATAFGREHIDPESEREISFVFCPGNMLTMSITKDQSLANEERYLNLELFTLAGTSCPWPTIGFEASVVYPGMWSIPGTDASIVPARPTPLDYALKIKEYMRQCDVDHPYCDIRCNLNKPLKAPYRSPGRFIEVGTDEYDVHLFEKPPAGCKYIALSYCWGKSIGLTLIRSNRHELSSCLPWSELLQTHKDAILLARYLDIRYLWIDALCIVQDDAEDKAAEIAHMSSIYTNAYLTISATSGIDGATGLFTPREPTQLISCHTNDGSVFGIWARKQPDHGPFRWGMYGGTTVLGERSVNDIASWYSKDRFPAFSRGWTFQERLLSPRIIHFTRHELVWECLGMTSCECGAMDQSVASQNLLERRYAAGVPHDVEVQCGKLERSQKLAKQLRFFEFGKGGVGVTPKVLSSRYMSDYALMVTIYGLAEEPGYPHEFPRKLEEMKNFDGDSNLRWRNLASQYSERLLGFATDVLPAISGFARVWHARREHPVPYYAGLWGDDLLRGVLWKAVGSEDMSRPSEYLAPSWSWASIRRPVDWFPSNYTPKYHVEFPYSTPQAPPKSPNISPLPSTNLLNPSAEQLSNGPSKHPGRTCGL